jgi:hypothetical protein
VAHLAGQYLTLPASEISPGYLAAAAAAAPDVSDNKAVANSVGGLRIDPSQMIAATRRESPGLLWLLRLALGFITSVIVLVFTGNLLGPWSFFPAIVVASVAAYAANGRRLLQIGAEIIGQSSRSIPTSATPSNPELVLVVNIFPGDWVCSADKYKNILEDADRKDRRQRDLAERRRVASGQTGVALNNNSQEVTKEPPIPLEFVIATDETSDKKRIMLESRDVLELSRDQFCYRRRPKVRPTGAPAIKDATQALSELLTALAQGSAHESDIINKLAESYHESSIHRALRAALSQRFIEQEVGLGRAFRELCAIFSLRMDAVLRRKCLVSLSQAGNIWTQSGTALEFRKEGSEAFGPESKSRITNNYIFGNQIFHTTISAQYFGKSGNHPPRMQKASGEDSVVTETRRVEANHDVSDGLTVAWSAGVSATGAGLAALFLTGEAPWQRAFFISLIFISCCTFVILILAGPPSVMSWWRRLRSTPPRRDASADTEPTNRGTE